LSNNKEGKFLDLFGLLINIGIINKNLIITHHLATKLRIIIQTYASQEKGCLYYFNNIILDWWYVCYSYRNKILILRDA
jgi:hypothetical protein